MNEDAPTAADTYLAAQRDLALALLSAESTQEALELCLDMAIRLSGLDLGGIYVVEEGTGDLVLTCQRGFSEAFVAAVERVPAASPRARIVAQRKPVYLDRAAIADAEEAKIPDEGLRCLAVIPVVHGEQVVACLNIASRAIEDIAARSRYILEMIGGMVGNAIARFRAQDALALSERRCRTLFETAPDAIFTMDRDGRLLSVNARAAQALGDSPEALVGRSIHEIAPGEIGNGGLGVVRRALDEGVSVWAHNVRSELEAPERWYDIVLSPLMNDAGEFDHVLGISRDVTERKRADEALRESEARYRALIESATDAIFAVSRAGVFLLANRTAAESLGRTPGEVIGRHMRDLFPAPVAESQLAAIQRVFDSGEAASTLGKPTVTATGERLYSTVLTPVRDESGVTAYVLGVARDVTEQRRADEALRESEARYRALVEAAPDSIYLVDVTGAIRSINPAAARMLGLTPEQAMGRSLYDVFPAEIADRRLRALRAVFETRQRMQLSYAEDIPGIGERWYEGVMAPVPDAEGNVAYVLGISRDITDRIQAHHTLRASEERYRTLVESASDAIITVDRDGVFLSINQEGARRLGRLPEEVVGRRYHELMDPQAAEVRLQRVRHVFSTGERLSARDKSRVPGIEHVSYDAVLTPVLDDAGRVAQVLVVARDVTAQVEAEEERRRMEARLQQAQKLESLGILAGGIAHDFGNLLTGVIGNVALARAQLDAASPAQPYLDQIEKAGVQAAQLSEQMLAYAGRGRVITQAVDLAEGVREISEVVESRLPATVALHGDLGEGLPCVLGDATQLRQVVLNLLTNAAEALGDSGGTVAISLGIVPIDTAVPTGTHLGEELAPGRYLCLRISDTGPGMDDRTLERIFDPFFSTKFAGRGLGLASVLGIVRGHRGAVSAQSSPGGGTTFEVLLPAADGVGARQTQAPHETARECSWTGEGTVLVADDEALVREVARDVLEGAGFTVMTARDGREALERFRAGVGDLVALVLDVTMPEISGPEVLKEVRRDHPGLPVVLASGYGEEETAGPFGGDGRTCFVRKPYQPAQLVAALREALGR